MMKFPQAIYSHRAIKGKWNRRPAAIIQRRCDSGSGKRRPGPQGDRMRIKGRNGYRAEILLFDIDHRPF